MRALVNFLLGCENFVVSGLGKNIFLSQEQVFNMLISGDYDVEYIEDNVYANIVYNGFNAVIEAI